MEDCQVCCRPIDLIVSVDDAGVPLVEVSTEDEA
ncbi:MAG TPA: CPXCG motif-containing cysteine-rich protein [Gammaproteobacteria bacterium]|nr:CPXCG motif-containing cysteine-rich protein [Gammaproteobacteria bacterium]